MWVRKLASSRCNLRYGVGSPYQEKRFYINIPFSHCSLSPSSITVLCTLHCRLIHHSSLRFAFCTRIFFHTPLPPAHSTSVLNRPASFSRLACWLGCVSSSGWLC